jgi:hypothetical protein
MGGFCWDLARQRASIVPARLGSAPRADHVCLGRRLRGWRDIATGRLGLVQGLTTARLMRWTFLGVVALILVAAIAVSGVFR